MENKLVNGRFLSARKVSGHSYRGLWHACTHTVPQNKTLYAIDIRNSL